MQRLRDQVKPEYYSCHGAKCGKCDVCKLDFPAAVKQLEEAVKLARANKEKEVGITAKYEGGGTIWDTSYRNAAATLEGVSFHRDGETIFHGDAVEILGSHVAPNSVDLIFADPPYNIGKMFGARRDKWASDQEYVQWCQRWLDLCLTRLKPTGTMYLMASTQAMPFLDLYVRERVTVLSRIVWAYDSSGVQARRYFGSLYEPILHCVADQKAYTFNADSVLVEAKTGAKRKLIDYRKPVPCQYSSKKVPGNVWTFPRVRYRMSEYEEHPTQKPEALLERIVLASSNPGDLVLDPFAGTFTTCAVAKRLARRSIGIEIERSYVGIGLRRLGISAELDGQKLIPIVKTRTRRPKMPKAQSDLFGEE